MTRFLRMAASIAALVTSGPALAAACAPQGPDPVDTVRRMYAAVTIGDRAATLAVFDADAYLFDVGKRYTPAALIDLILKIEAAGTRPQWHVDDAETHIACDQAWSTWTNHGSFTSAKGTQPLTWLESAVFVWRDGAWKVRFFHSTRIDPAA
jgi:hypothetical protein